ncbi:putative GPI-anchored protein 58 [Iris pallida]|uniref:GPI-anchored protein 58 n=1 Tax=Iris pallida TaxID=29817 RepID=A0AAX6G7N0_IRIPA|nr:putative GPI-anchored protein 58 [Iris pallida]
MQTEHHPHSSTRQHFHPPSLADDPSPWPAWPSATADSTSTIISTHCRHHHFDSPAPPSQSCAAPPPHRAHGHAQSHLAGLAWARGRAAAARTGGAAAAFVAVTRTRG